MLESGQIKQLYIALGSRIKDERERGGHKQTHFAELLQISRASLVNIEKGRQRAPIHILYEISRLLNISVSELMPELNSFLSIEVNKLIQEKIEKKSAGNQDLQQKLMDFVKSHTTTSKLSI